MISRRSALTILFACAIPVAALFLSVGWRQPQPHELGWTDLPWYFTPTFAVLHRALVDGFFPLWNPWQLAGWPFLAAFQTQVLYPPAWAVAWLPPHLAVTAYNAIHWAWTFAGMSAFATGIGLAAPAAMAAAALFTLSGPITTGFFVHSAGLAACSWLPWIALAATRIARSPATMRPARPVLALAASLAMALLAGAPEHFFYLSAAVMAVGLWQGAEANPRGLARTAWMLGAGFAIAALLCAAQILPTVELMQHAVRIADTFDADYIARFQAPGGPLARAAAGIAGGPGHLTRLFLPLVFLALLSRRTRRPALVALALGAVVLDHLRGNEGFVFPFAYEWIPFVRAFRTQLRAEFVWAFFGSLAVAYGVEAVSRWRPERKVVRAAAVALAAAVLVETAARSLPGHVFIVLQDPALLYGTADLKDALAEAPGPERLFVHYGPASAGLQHKLGQMHGVRQVADYDALVPASYARLFRMPTDKPWMGRLQFADRTKDLGVRSVHIPGVELASLDLLATRYYLARAPAADSLAARVGGVTRYRKEYAVVERAAARPRAYVVHDAIAAASSEDALDRIRAPGFDAATTAVVTGTPPLLDKPVAGAAEHASVTLDEPNRVVVRATCASRCLMVLADLHFPGWQASIDGRDTTILTANSLLRAVVLDAGDHEIAFRYRPRPLMVGLAVSLATLAGIAVALFRGRRRAGL